MHHLNILTHVAAGTLALLIGLFPLLSRKGGPVHRFTGWLFVAAGSGVLGCAMIGITLYAQPVPLMMATASAAYQFIGGLRALPRFRAPRLFDSLLALAALAIGAVLFHVMSRGNASWPPAVGYGILGYLGVVALYDLSRPLWRRAWQGIRHLDHGLKMTGAYFAMASAGAGNLLRGGQPWSQLLPSAIGIAVMALILARAVMTRRPSVADTQ
jgi:hypothetical protein